jgi:hypothetical protein
MPRSRHLSLFRHTPPDARRATCCRWWAADEPEISRELLNDTADYATSLLFRHYRHQILPLTQVNMPAKTRKPGLANSQWPSASFIGAIREWKCSAQLSFIADYFDTSFAIQLIRLTSLHDSTSFYSLSLFRLKLQNYFAPSLSPNISIIFIELYHV